MPAAPVMSVSSFSLREQLGPIVFSFRAPDGSERTFTLDAPRLFPISEFPRRAADAFGVEAVETVGFQFTGLDDPEIDRFEKGLRDAGVGLLNICLDFGDLADADAERRAGDVALTRRWIERFAAMGATFVRVNPGSPLSPGATDTPAEHLVEALVGLGGFAAAQGTRLLVENHVGPSADPVWMSALLDAVGSDAVGLLLDLGNFPALQQALHALGARPERPGEEEAVAIARELDLSSLYDGITALAPRAEMVSVKEHLVTPDYIGFVDLERAVGILRAHDFAGPYSVEYEGEGGDPWWKAGRVLEATRELAAGANVAAR